MSPPCYRRLSSSGRRVMCDDAVPLLGYWMEKPAALSFEWWYSLQDHALLLLLLAGEQCSARGVLEDFPHALVGLGGALEVLLCANLLADVLSLEVCESVLIQVRECEQGSAPCRDVRTCSGVTGFCDVLCSSSIVFWSYLKSFLHPTRMIGRPWQKCNTSEIHCYTVTVSYLSRQAVVAWCCGT